MLYITYYLISLSFLYMGICLFSSPLTLSLYLVVVSIYASLCLSQLIGSWFMFILILVFSGGMMIMTVYVTNLSASNKLSEIWVGVGLILLAIISSPLNSYSMNLVPGNLITSFTFCLLGFILFFLLLGLFLIISFISKNKGALRY